MAGSEHEGQIAALVFRALSSFESLLSNTDSTSATSSTVASHSARFKLWVGSLGAHRSSGGRSLEYRLRDASTIKHQIISLLQDLNDSLSQGLSSEKGVTVDKDKESSSDPTDAELEDYFRDDEDSGDSEIKHALEDIGHVVDCLLRLSITIRNPAPHDHFRSRTGTNLSSLYEEWDIRHAREKFPNASSGVIERLGRATAQRRQYFKYREDHTNRLAEGLVTDNAMSEFGGSLPEKATTVASSIPSYLKEGEAGTQTPSSKFAHFSDTESIASMTSYAPSTAQTGQLRVPPLPKEANVGPFKCPYCCLILSVGSKQEWKKHVFRDLRPYACTKSFCTKPEQLYQRRSDWIAHMKEEHWRTWNCPFGCHVAFDSPESFAGHVKGEHPSEIASQRLDTLQGLSGHFDPRKIEKQCPLCDDFKITSEKQFGMHVGTHLEQLALFALPHHGDEDESEGDSRESNLRMKRDDDIESSDSSLRYEEDGDVRVDDTNATTRPERLVEERDRNSSEGEPYGNWFSEDSDNGEGGVESPGKEVGNSDDDIRDVSGTFSDSESTSPKSANYTSLVPPPRQVPGVGRRGGLPVGFKKPSKRGGPLPGDFPKPKKKDPSKTDVSRKSPGSRPGDENMSDGEKSKANTTPEDSEDLPLQTNHLPAQSSRKGKGLDESTGSGDIDVMGENQWRSQGKDSSHDQSAFTLIDAGGGTYDIPSYKVSTQSASPEEDKIDHDKPMDDIVNIECSKGSWKLTLPHRSISSGKVVVSDLIRHTNIFYKLERNDYKLALFFKDRIYGDSNTPVRDIGVTSGSRVKVLEMKDDGLHPDAIDTLLQAKILSEMKDVRSKFSAFMERWISSETGDIDASYTEIRNAVAQFVRSLEELSVEGALMKCWKDEMTNQARQISSALFGAGPMISRLSNEDIDP